MPDGPGYVSWAAALQFFLAMRTELVHFLSGPGQVNHRKSLERAIQDATDTRVQFVVWPYPSMRVCWDRLLTREEIQLSVQCTEPEGQVGSGSMEPLNRLLAKMGVYSPSVVRRG
jgi:hypothetical protein